MNRFAKNIIYVFLSDDNSKYLKDRLTDFFTNNAEIKEYLDSDLRRRQYLFSQRISRELSVSDPMEGTTISDQVLAYNTQFLQEITKDIEADILPNLTPLYTVVDKPQCNGRSSASYCANPNGTKVSKDRKVLTADETLAKWNDNPGALQQYRDDNQGDYKASDKNIRGDKCYNAMYDKPAEYCAIASGTSRYCGNASTGWGLRQYNTYRDPRDVYVPPKQGMTEPSAYVPRNPAASVFAPSREYKEGFGNRQTGAIAGNYSGIGLSDNVSVDFCDQSDVGTSSYYSSQFDTPYIQALNRDPQPHTSQPFGYSTAASDERLLSRRIFRNNEAGVENGISRYEVRLQRRNLDRDNGETFADTQYDYVQRGHDMGDLLRRTNAKTRVVDKRAYDNSMTDKLRYSGLFL
jgi:hypothetical protein